MKMLRLILNKSVNGRGAYVCKSVECFNKMEKGNRLKNALKMNLENKKYEELRGVIFGDIK